MRKDAFDATRACCLRVIFTPLLLRCCLIFICAFDARYAPLCSLLLTFICWWYFDDASYFFLLIDDSALFWLFIFLPPPFDATLDAAASHAADSGVAARWLDFAALMLCHDATPDAAAVLYDARWGYFLLWRCLRRCAAIAAAACFFAWFFICLSLYAIRCRHVCFMLPCFFAYVFAPRAMFISRSSSCLFFCYASFIDYVFFCFLFCFTLHAILFRYLRAADTLSFCYWWRQVRHFCHTMPSLCYFRHTRLMPVVSSFRHYASSATLLFDAICLLPPPSPCYRLFSLLMFAFICSSSLRL